jgi:hypothetical protein
MRTYRKHAKLSMMPSPLRSSLPIPCHVTEIHPQAIDFTGLRRETAGIFPLFPWRQGKIAISSLRQPGDTIGWHAPGEREQGLMRE